VRSESTVHSVAMLESASPFCDSERQIQWLL
jgi:hypothetical protein